MKIKNLNNKSIKTIKNFSIFVAVVMAMTTFTSCENQFDSSDVADRDFVVSIKTHNMDFNALYHSGEYDYLFNQFTSAFSIAMHTDSEFRAMVLQEFMERGRNLLLKHLAESDVGLLSSALSPYVDACFFLEYFQGNMRIRFNGNVEVLAMMHATNNIESVGIAFKPADYKLGQSDVVLGLVSGETPFQHDYREPFDGSLIVLELTTNSWLYEVAVAELTNVFEEIANANGIDVNFEVVDMFGGIDEINVPEFSRIITRNATIDAGWNIDASTTMRLTKTSGDNLTVIATPHKDNPNIVSYVIMTSIDDEAIGFVAGFDFEVPLDEFGPIDVFDRDGRRIPWRDRWGDWWERQTNCANYEVAQICGGAYGGTHEWVCNWTSTPANIVANVACLIFGH